MTWIPPSVWTKEAFPVELGDQAFAPDAIRGRLEATLQILFSPAAHDPATAYTAGNRASANGSVYRAIGKVVTADPPDPEWELEGPVYPVLYENVPAKIPAKGAVRMAISWGNTDPMAIRCNTGRMQRVTGVLTCWIYTPANEGTRAGLLAIKRLRDELRRWNPPGVDPNGTTPAGEYVRVTNPNGPRSSGPANGFDFFTHNLTATLTVIEIA